MHRRLESEPGDDLSERTEKQCSVLTLGVDSFRRYTDDNGCLAGDRALCAMAKILLNQPRPVDVVVRYDDEKFPAVPPGTDADTGVRVAEDLRLMIEESPSDWRMARCFLASWFPSAQPLRR